MDKRARRRLQALCSDKRSYMLVRNFPTDLLFFDVFDAQIKKCGLKVCRMQFVCLQRGL